MLPSDLSSSENNTQTRLDWLQQNGPQQTGECVRRMEAI